MLAPERSRAGAWRTWRTAGAGWLLVMVGAAAAGLAFRPALGDQRLTVVVIASAATATALVALGVALGLRRGARTLISGLVWVVLAGVLLPDAPAWTVLRSLAADLAMGAALLLDYVPPAPESASLLVLPSALTWLAAGAASELVLRTASPLVPGVPVMSIWVLAVGLSVPGDGRHVAGALVMLAALLLLLYRSTGRHLRARPLSGLLAVAVVVAVAAGVAVSTGGIGAHALDLREHRQHNRLTVRHDVVADYFAWQAQPEGEVFVAEPGGAGQWRLASLDRFDGERWTTSAEFRRAGLSVPAMGEVPVRGRILQQRVQLTDPVVASGAFLPHVDRLVEIRGGLGMWVDVDAGMLYANASQQGQYAVGSITRSAFGPDTDLVSTGGRLRATHLEIPAACRDLAAALHGSSPGAVETQQADEVTLRLAAEVARRLPGHANATPQDGRSLGCALLADAVARGQGTHEQHVVALVLAARHLGLPARLAVGFAAGMPTNAGRTTAGERWRVTGGDARLWAEVHLDDRGWVPVHPASAEQSATPPTAETESRSLQDPEETPREDGAGFAGAGSRTTTTFLLYVVLAVVTIFALIGAVRRLRAVWRSSRSRRRGSPSDRVAAAWRDTIALLARGGMPAPASATPSELLAVAGEYAGSEVTEDLRELTMSHRLAWYARAPMDEGQAEEAWRQRDRVRQAVRRTRRTRLVARLQRTAI